MNLIINDTDHPLIIKVASIQAARMQVYFIDNEDYFGRDTVYGCYDDGERFAFFAKAVVEAGIKRCVIAMKDPNPLVAGRGIKILEDAGVETVCGVLEEEARRLNEVFLKWVPEKMPFVALKTAMTLDGKIATRTGESQWITNETSRRRVHEYRDRYDGIFVGIGTVLHDDPSLTTRLPDGTGKNPVRIIVDSQARTPLTAKVVCDGQAKTIVAVTEQAPAERCEALEAAGVEVVRAGTGAEVDLRALMQMLGQREICSVFVEGGGRVNFSLLRAGLVDKVYAFIAPKLIGGSEALTPVEGAGFAALKDCVELSGIQVEEMAGDILLTAYTRH